MDLEEQDAIGKERIRQEIIICRQDEQSSQSMQLQAIGTAGAILGAFLGASFFFQDDSSPFGKYLWVLSILGDLIFLLAYSYITHLGIENVLRYHYLQDLEVQLGQKNNANSVFLDWMGTVSPVTTRNIKNVRHIYTVMHFFSYMSVPVLAFLFCGLIACILYNQVTIHRNIAKIGLECVVAVSILDFLFLIIGSSNSYKIYKWSKQKAEERRSAKLQYYGCSQGKSCGGNMNCTISSEHLGEEFQKKEIFRGVLYFIYPKLDDAQKMFLIVMGALCALAYRAKDFQSCVNEARVHWADFLIAFLVIELLLYAARYQLNDLRGAPEDAQTNDLRRRQGKGNHGMPRMLGNKKKDVNFSLFFTVIKFILSIIILRYLWHKEASCGAIDWRNSLAHSLSAVSVLIIIATILYEWSRTFNKPRWIVFFVGFGYMLRFWAGFLAVQPNIAIAWENPSIGLLLIAMYFYGIMVATLPWTYYTVQEKASWQETPSCSDKYTKPYYEWFSNYISCLPHKQGGNDSLIKKVCAPWNLGLISPILVILAIVFSHRSANGGIIFWIFLLLISLFFLSTYLILYFCFDKDFSIYNIILGTKTINWLQKQD